MAQAEFVFRVDLFSDLLAQLSDEGISNLEGSIVAEKYRRKEIREKFPELR